MFARRFASAGIALALLAPGEASAAQRPDLVQVSVSRPPQNVAAGMSFTIRDKVKNKGDRKASKSTTAYYLSLDRKRSNNDLKLGRRKVPRLGPGDASRGSRLVIVPSDAPLGRFYVLACADANKAVPEKDESNNCRSAETRVRVRAPTCREQLFLLEMDFSNGPQTVGIDNPVTVHPPIAGVAFTNFKQILNADIKMDCRLALRLHQMATGLVTLGIDEVEQWGVYNYRCISGQGTPPDCPTGVSQHAYGMAIDLASFSGDTTYVVEDHWTPDFNTDTCTQTTTSVEHLFLRDLVCSWAEDDLFNIILTPNYNADHHNHIHVDLTPGANFID